MLIIEMDNQGGGEAWRLCTASNCWAPLQFHEHSEGGRKVVKSAPYPNLLESIQG